jgi:hypothetical protein
MPLLQVLVILLLIGLLIGVINKYGAEYIDSKWIKLINIVAIVFTIIWLVGLIFGGFGSLSNIRVGR